MPAKIIASLLTLLINVTAGVIIFFFLLLGLNGYSESDATYGLSAYFALALVVSFSMSLCAGLVAHILMKRNFRGWTAALIAVPIFSVTGIVLKIACVIAAAAVTEYVRVNY
jgi:hypothetical protein